MIKLLSIGDSISPDYRKYLKDFLDKEIKIYSKKGIEEAYADLDRAVGANGGNSANVLEYIKYLDAEGILDFDYCIFNCGLHDIKLHAAYIAGAVNYLVHIK